MDENKNHILEFGKRFGKVKNQKIALYGYNITTVELINYYDYNFVCIIDDNESGRYVNDILVVKFQQAMLLDIETIIISSLVDTDEILSNQIGGVCKQNNINLFDIYGKDLFLLQKNVLMKNIKYPRLEEEDLLKEILAHEVIFFSIENVVFTAKSIYSANIYKEINKRLIKQNIIVEEFTDKIVTIKKENPFDSFYSLIRKLSERENLTEQVCEEIIELVYEVGKNIFIPRASVLKAIQHAILLKKKVCLIEDMPDYRMPREFWEMLLKEYSINLHDHIICSSDYLESKEDGLMRRARENYREASILYIGDNNADLMLAQDFDMDIFLVKSPSELFKRTDPMGIGMLDNPRICSLFEDYLIKVYNDDYLMSQVKEKCNKERTLAWNIESRVLFYRNNGGIVAKEPIVYEAEIFEDIDETLDIETYTKLFFARNNNPIVSIIIPVYNQFGYTYNCLKAILNYTKNIDYEVIVADDCSDDHTKELEKVVNGITIIHNKKNLKFLLNCNQAAKYASGKYILFLNNDTQVQPGWLPPMLRLLEENESVGMVGAKLVYPEGVLQEAGGIIWKDGSAWNYGHMKNPDEPEFSYVKEVDYISGASIMIRADLWHEIGGFDVSFAPAYYEDTDLAFEVRKHGYKVLFQPESIVVHYEGVSNGTDISFGQKRFQVENQKKFYAKWNLILENEHFENGTNVYLAKDRGQKKKQILVIDHYIPNFDKDAGGRCTFMYMKLLIKLGFKVTFIGDNYAKTEPYATMLNQLGIEIVCGHYYYTHWGEWLRDNVKYFDYVYLQRPHIAIKYIDIIKKYGDGKIFYFAHDLHFIRIYRNYLISGDADLLKESNKWKEVELELFAKADVGHVVGSYEQKLMQEIFPEKPIRNIPLYVYDSVPQQIEKDFIKRKDILFVGGFNHTPNIDAVLWFGKNVFPKILEHNSEIVWHIVGSNAPSSVEEIVSDHIVLDGFLEDSELEMFYQRCRMVVVPLRYGAGVKGKIVEAAYYQIPVVTTSIGGEGLDVSVGSFLVEDDADKMADLIVELYTDFEKLREMSDAGKDMIQKYFTSAVAEEVLKLDMNMK